jgi:predicted RNA methylase
LLPAATASYSASQFQQFYTDAEEIRSLMCDLLGPVDGLAILEPAAGLGAFAAALHGTPSRLDAVDIDGRHIEHLRASALPWLNPVHADFIDVSLLGGPPNTDRPNADYDALIANPPYGLRFSLAYRRKIKRRFPHLYARESYGLFMHFGIQALKQNGRYVFVVPDTFLTSRNHTPLRKFLVGEGRPTHIIRFPSKRFEQVDFGYGHLCIIAGHRTPLDDRHTILWVDSVAPEARISTDLFSNSEQVPARFLTQHVSDGWVPPAKRAAISLRVPSSTLGELADCRTGIYTGDNVRFCGFDAANPPARASNGRSVDWRRQVKNEPLSETEKREGITGQRSYVPLIRGGHRSPFASTAWALDWSTDAVRYYASDKKARLQNSRFYFRPGLAVPMVTSGRISASLMEEAVFDQGVVGIFPHDDGWRDLLLIYLNSDFVSRAVKAVVNPGANNSANYIKRIPVPLVSREQLAAATCIVDTARQHGWEETVESRNAFTASLLKGVDYQRK